MSSTDGGIHAAEVVSAVLLLSVAFLSGMALGAVLTFIEMVRQVA